jgi:hypothetical protein
MYVTNYDTHKCNEIIYDIYAKNTIEWVQKLNDWRKYVWNWA